MRIISGMVNMLKSVEGIYRDGKIELTELPSDVRAETRVIVTFLESRSTDLDVSGFGRDPVR